MTKLESPINVGNNVLPLLQRMNPGGGGGFSVPMNYGGNVSNNLRNMGVPVSGPGPAHSFNSIEAQTRQAAINQNPTPTPTPAPVVTAPNPFDYADNFDAYAEADTIHNSFGGRDLTAGYESGAGAGVSRDYMAPDYFDTGRFPGLTLEEAGILTEIERTGAVSVDDLVDYSIVDINSDGTIDPGSANDAITGLEVYLNQDNLTQEDRLGIESLKNNLIDKVDGQYGIGDTSGDLYDFNTNAEKRAWLENSGVAIDSNKIARAEEAAKNGIYYDEGANGFYKPKTTFAQSFDNFTDGAGNVVSSLLSPIDWAADAVGGGFKAIGSGIGDNAIGRGVSNFGGWLDRTGDYITEDLPNRLINYPDNLVNIGQGVYQVATGDNPGGQITGWDLAKSGAKGLVTDAAYGIRDAVGVGADLVKNVFGVDDVKFSFGVGGGGGTQRGGSSAPGSSPGNSSARPSRVRTAPKYSSSSGRLSGGSGGSGDSGGSIVNVGKESYDLSKQGDREAYSSKYGATNLQDHLDRMADGISSNNSIDNSSPFDDIAPASSKIKAAMLPNQGNNQSLSTGSDWLDSNETPKQNIAEEVEKVISKKEKENDDTPLTDVQLFQS